VAARIRKYANNQSGKRRRRDRAHALLSQICVFIRRQRPNFIRRQRPKKKKCLGGQRNPLKRLISDKGIQGNQSFFSWISLAGLGLALLDLAKFGIGLENQSRLALAGTWICQFNTFEI